MVARYQFYKKPRTVLNDSTEETFYPRVVNARTVTLEEVFEDIADSSTFTVADCAGVMRQIEYHLLNQLLEGNKVHWEGVGTFSIRLSCESISDPKEIRAESIKGKSVAFRMDKKLKDRIKHIRVSKIGPYTERKTPDETQRRENLEWFLKNHQETIGTQKYMALNGCSRRVARADLIRFCEEGSIRLIPGSYVYVLNNKKDKV